MAKRRTHAQAGETSGATVGYEAQLWQMADALRGSMDAADPEDPDEYRGAAHPVFWVPPEARWPQLKAQARQPTNGQLVDDAMSGIERDNPALKGVLPKDYARPALDKQRLGTLTAGRRHEAREVAA